MFEVKSDIPSHKGKKPNEKDVTCPNCGKVFSKKENVKKHIKDVHEEKRKISKGMICGAVFENSFDFEDITDLHC